MLVLLSSVPLFQVTAVNFTPEDDQSQFDVTMRAPEGTSLAAMNVIANRLGAAIRQIPEVEFTLVTVAGDAAGTLNSASMLVRLHPIEDRAPRSVRGDGARSATRSCRRFKDAGLRTAVQVGGGPGGGGGAIQFMIQGPDLGQLEPYSEALREQADRHPRPGRRRHDAQRRQARAVGLRSTGPKAADLGVQIADAAEALRLLVAGDQVTTYNEGGEQYEVHLRAQEQNRSTQAGAGRGCRCPRRASASSRSTTSPRFARGDAPATHQPHGPPAAGDAHRQPAAGHLAGRGAAADHRGGAGA